jgi:putative DNA-invertase from lambdoid prophage Rac
MPRNARKTAAAPLLDPRVYGYCRVSTARQADDGESLDVQTRQIAGYAMLHDLAVTETFVERGVSGSKPISERPEGARLLAVLRPGDIAITPKLDRMFRGALDAREILRKLKARGVSPHMIALGGDVTGNGISKLDFTILSALSAVAEADRERIADVKRDQRECGQYLGGVVPFGFQVGDDGGLVPVAEQQAPIAVMRQLRGEGRSLRAIAQEITASGVPISHMGVRNVLATEPAEEIIP